MAGLPQCSQTTRVDAGVLDMEGGETVEWKIWPENQIFEPLIRQFLGACPSKLSSWHSMNFLSVSTLSKMHATPSHLSASIYFAVKMSKWHRYFEIVIVMSPSKHAGIFAADIICSEK